MTTQQSFKRRIRARMEKTGESYTAARAQLLPEAEWEARISAEKVRERTGRTWNDWFAVLDAWGAAERAHRQAEPHGPLRLGRRLDPRDRRLRGEGRGQEHGRPLPRAAAR